MASVSWATFLLSFHLASGVGHVGWENIKTQLEHPDLTADEKQYVFGIVRMSYLQLLEVVNINA